MKTDQKKLQVVDSNSRMLHYTTRFLVILIAAGAGILSFDGLAQLAIVAGVREELAYVWALVIDGFILVATFATFTLKDRAEGDRIKKYYAWVVLAIFVIISIFGNAMHSLPLDAEYTLPQWVKISVNAVPPIALFLAIHLIIIMVSPTSDEKKDKESAKRRKDREDKMLERRLIAEERANEREAQKIEAGAAQTLKTQTPPAALNPQPTKASTQPNIEHIKPKTLSNIEPEPAPQRTNDPITKEEAVEQLLQMLNNGEQLPSGRIVGEWIGLKERAGQNLLKKAKEEHEALTS